MNAPTRLIAKIAHGQLPVADGNAWLSPTRASAPIAPPAAIATSSNPSILRACAVPLSIRSVRTLITRVQPTWHSRQRSSLLGTPDSQGVSGHVAPAVASGEQPLQLELA